MANIGPGGEGPSNPPGPGGGGDPAHAALSHLDDDLSNADFLITEGKALLHDFDDIYQNLPDSLRTKYCLEAQSSALNLLNQTSKEDSFLSLPSDSPLFKIARYHLMHMPAEHLKAVIPDPVPYLPRGSYSDYSACDRSLHHRAAAGFCAVVAADMWVVTDKWARMYGLSSGLSMEECFLLARRALSLLYPEDKLLGEDGPTTFHVSLVKYFEYLKKLRVDGVM